MAEIRAHHRLLHEEGFTVTSGGPGAFEFFRPDGTPITNPVVTVPTGDGPLRQANARHGVVPDANTQTPDWDGTRPDYGMIVEHLLYLDDLLDDDRPHST